MNLRSFSLRVCTARCIGVRGCVERARVVLGRWTRTVHWILCHYETRARTRDTFSTSSSVFESVLLLRASERDARLAGILVAFVRTCRTNTERHTHAHRGYGLQDPADPVSRAVPQTKSARATSRVIVSNRYIFKVCGSSRTPYAAQILPLAARSTMPCACGSRSYGSTHSIASSE